MSDLSDIAESIGTTTTEQTDDDHDRLADEQIDHERDMDEYSGGFDIDH